MFKKMNVVRERSFYRQVLTIMVPVVLQQAINIGVNMMDTIMLGKLGEAQISASSLANSFYMLYAILCMGINGGCSVLASQYWGKGDKDKARESFTLALWFAAGTALMFAAVTAFFPAQIMRIYTPDPAVIGYGVRYLRFAAFTYFFHGTGLVVALMMRSVHKPKLGLYVSIVSFFVNIFFNWVFIFGKLGAPRMEIAGAALGTLLARISEFLVTFIYVFKFDTTLNFRPKHVFQKPTKELFYNYGRLGSGALVSDCLLGIGSNTVSMIMGRMGAAVVAANAICMTVDRLCTVVVGGVSNASAIITGQTVGRGDIEGAKKQGNTFYLMSIALGIIGGILIMIFGSMMIGLYELEPETVVIAEQMMMTYAMISVFHCIQAVMTKGVLRGGGDTRFLMVADVLFLWVLSIPAGYISGLVLHAPAWVTITCLHAEWVVKSFWCIGRLRSGKWIRQTVALPKK